jgi:hypothetical protein
MPILPGNRRSTRLARDINGETKRVSRVSDPELDAAILLALAGEPLMRRDIEAKVRESEMRVYGRLSALRRAGKVKTIGKMQSHKRWAMKSWKSRPVTDTHRVVFQTRQEAARTGRDAGSWWLNAMDREDFSSRAAEQFPRLSNGKKRTDNKSQGAGEVSRDS